MYYNLQPSSQVTIVNAWTRYSGTCILSVLFHFFKSKLERRQNWKYCVSSTPLEKLTTKIVHQDEFFLQDLQLHHSPGATWSRWIISVNHATTLPILLRIKIEQEKNLILLISASTQKNLESIDHQSFLRHYKENLKRPNLRFFLSCQVNVKTLIWYLFFLHTISYKCLC